MHADGCSPKRATPLRSIRQSGCSLVDLLDELVSDLRVFEEFAEKVVVYTTGPIRFQSSTSSCSVAAASAKRKPYFSFVLSYSSMPTTYLPPVVLKSRADTSRVDGLAVIGFEFGCPTGVSDAFALELQGPFAITPKGDDPILLLYLHF